MKAIFKNQFNQHAMKKSQMDNYFKNKLDKYDSGAPDNLWAAIEAKREKPERIVPWTFWIGSAALALVVVALLFQFYNKENQLTHQEVISTVSQEIIKKETVVTPEIATAEVENNIALVENEEEETKPALKQMETVIKKEKEVIPESVIFTKKEVAVEEKLSVAPTLISESTNKRKVDELAQLPRLRTNMLSTEDKGPGGCYSFSGGRGGQSLLDALYFDAFGGLGYAFRQLENTGDSDNDFYLDARDSTEREWYSFGGGLRANLRYNSGFTVRVGLQYSQINEIFEITDGNSTRITTIEIRDAEGNVIGTETITEQGELFKKTFNRLRLVDVPVMLGYEWTKKKMTFSANAGAAFNLRFSQKGDFLSDNLEPVSFSSNDPNRFDFFRTRVGVSLIGSVGMTYQLKNNLDFLVEPQVRYYPTSVGESTISQKYTDVGLFTGLRYYFVSRKRN